MPTREQNAVHSHRLRNLQIVQCIPHQYYLTSGEWQFF